MDPLIVLTGAAAALFTGWKLETRRRLTSLRWARQLRPLEIAQRCHRYLRAYGIASYVLRPDVEFGNCQPDHDFNLRIPNEQFGKRTGVFKLICRDSEFISGQLFFKDTIAKLKLGNDPVATAIALVTSPLDSYSQASAAMWGVAVLTVPELREFVEALKQAKDGSEMVYTGKSDIIRAAFLPRPPDRDVVAKGFEVAALEADRAGDWPLAEKRWRDFMEKFPERWQSYLSLSKVLVAQGRTTEASRLLAGAWSRFSRQPEVGVFAASFAEENDNPKEAVKIWAELVARFPDDWRGYQGTISALFAYGRHEEARAFIDLHEARFPDEPGARFAVAKSAEQQENWSRAEAAWRIMVSLSSRQGWHYARLADSLIKQGRYSEAKLMIRTGLEYFPDHDGLLNAAIKHEDKGGVLQS